MESLGIGTGDFVVNVQGDEPLLDPATIEGVILRLQNGAQVATAAAPLRGDPDDPSVVKLVVDSSGRAVYFSRSAIPSGGPWLQHIGIYGFRPDALRRFSQLPASFLEKSERLEQLRLLEHGIPVDVIRVAEAGLSVDTPEDLARARKMISRTVQRSTPPSLLESSSLD
jgi:3-deoxy-manno-octulosonate cytidylyltransferase (CMP-KDO synthetase)